MDEFTTAMYEEFIGYCYLCHRQSLIYSNNIQLIPSSSMGLEFNLYGQRSLPNLSCNRILHLQPFHRAHEVCFS